MKEIKITLEQQNWILNRVDYSHTGRVLISQSAVNKVRKILNDYDSPNSTIKSKIVNLEDEGNCILWSES